MPYGPPLRMAHSFGWATSGLPFPLCSHGGAVPTLRPAYARTSKAPPMGTGGALRCAASWMGLADEDAGLATVDAVVEHRAVDHERRGKMQGGVGAQAHAGLAAILWPLLTTV